LTNERERSHRVIVWLGASSVLYAQQLGAAIFSLSAIEKATFPVDILSIIYCKNNLTIDNKKRLKCFYEHSGYYFEFLSAMS
jgi:hypothetical protein